MKKFIHQWTIKNFNHFYTEEPGYFPLLFSQSDYFPKDKGRQFYLRLYPNGLNKDCEKFVSISLHLCEGESVEIESCKLAFLDSKNLEQNVKVSNKTELLTVENELKFNEFFPVDDVSVASLRRGYFPGWNCTIFCEIIVKDGIDDSNEPIKSEETKSETDAQVSFTRLQHNWNINGFPHYAKKGDYICLSSKDFSYSDQDDNKFFLRLWPQGRDPDNQSEAHLSLYLYLLTRQREKLEKLTVQYKISLIDSETEKHTKLNRHQIISGNELGYSQYVLLDSLLDQKNLLPENLKINCVVEIINEEKCEENIGIRQRKRAKTSHDLPTQMNISVSNSTFVSGKGTLKARDLKHRQINS